MKRLKIKRIRLVMKDHHAKDYSSIQVAHHTTPILESAPLSIFVGGE